MSNESSGETPGPRESRIDDQDAVAANGGDAAGAPSKDADGPGPGFGPEEPTDGTGEDTPHPVRSRPGRMSWPGLWNSVTAITALLALLISADSWVRLRSEPDIAVQVGPRIDALYIGGRTELNLDLAFQVLNRTDRLAYVDDVRLRLQKREEPAQTRELTWYWVGFWGREGSGDVIFMFRSQKSPILVTRDAVAGPLLKFTMDDQDLTAGVWDATVDFTMTGSDPFTEKFCLGIAGADIQRMVRVQNRPQPYRNDPPGPTAEPPGCYRSSSLP